MTISRALALTAVLIAAGLAEAAAQFPPPPGSAAPQSGPFPPPGQSQTSPFPPPGQQPSNPFPPGGLPYPSSGARPQSSFPPPGGAKSICEQFPAIRDQTQKDGEAIKMAGDRKVAREEMCALFNKFVASESKMAKFLETNQAACGVPLDAIKQVKGQHAKSMQIRKQICSAAPTAAQGPSLSDALGGPILSDEPPKPGRGTFDTLTGNALGR